MSWGRTRDGQLLTPRRQKLIRAYHARRDMVGCSFFWNKWTADQRTAFRQWRSDFMKEDRYRWSRNARTQRTARGASDGKI